MSIDWVFEESGFADDNKILLIFPGLTGGSQSAYLKSFVPRFQQEGYRIGILHGKGIENTMLGF